MERERRRHAAAVADQSSRHTSDARTVPARGCRRARAVLSLVSEPLDDRAERQGRSSIGPAIRTITPMSNTVNVAPSVRKVPALGGCALLRPERPRQGERGDKRHIASQRHRDRAELHREVGRRASDRDRPRSCRARSASGERSRAGRGKHRHADGGRHEYLDGDRSHLSEIRQRRLSAIELLVTYSSAVRTALNTSTDSPYARALLLVGIGRAQECGDRASPASERSRRFPPHAAFAIGGGSSAARISLIALASTSSGTWE